MLQRIEPDDSQDLGDGPLPSRDAVKKAIEASFVGRARQEDVAAVAGVDQTTVSRWKSLTSKSLPNLLEAAAIEVTAGRPLGWIATQVGLVADVTTVSEALAVDPNLDDAARAALLRGYNAAVEHRRRVLAAEDAGDDGPLDR